MTLNEAREVELDLTQPFQESDPGSARPSVAQPRGTVLQVSSDDTVVLPDGVVIARIEVSGANLIIVGQDGTRFVIPDGAINIPQVVVDGVVIPPVNIAALLPGNEPQPAAGPPQSSGGNFATDPGAIQAAYGLGDLLPYTETELSAGETDDVIPQPLDRDVAVVIITPDQPVGSVIATTTVDEAALPARSSEPAGTDESSTTETTVGQVVFDAPDGVASVSVNGTEILTVGQTIATPFGTFTITDIAPGQFGYSYTLTDNSIATGPSDVFTIVLTDADGDVATGELTILIADDAPQAIDDAAAQSAPNASVTVNVLANDIPGADGVQPSTVAFVAGSLSGTGNVVNNGDGTLTYVPGPAEAGSVTFDYRIADGDGDESIATVTINLMTDTVVSASNGAATTSDAAGDADPGSNVNAFTPQVSSGTLAIAYGSDGFGSFTASYDGALGAAVKTSAAGVTTFTSASWTLTIDETTGAYVFTQTAPYAHDPGASSDSGIVTVSVADSDDVAPVTVNLTLTITDDAPLAVNDGSGATEGGATLNGNVIANDDVGADLPGTVSAARTGPEAGAGTALVVGTPYVSTFGTLTLNADGSYSYTPNGSVPAGSVDVFTYTLIDADGDTDTAELRFTFAGDNSNASASNGAATTSDAAGDADPGSNVNAFTPQVSSGTLAIAYGSDGFGSFTASYDGALGAAVKTSAAGVTTFTSASWTLTIDETTGAYVFTQTAPYAHDPGASSDSGIVTVSVADSDDVAPVTVNLTLTITDDAPLAVNDGSGATEGGATLNGNVIANDDVGADLPGTVSAARTGPEAGAGTALVVGTPYVSTFGTLTLNADGSYSYTPNGSVPAGSVDVFTYTLIDADGDTDTAELRFTFAGDNSNASASNGAATTSDAAGDADPGSNVNAFTPQVSSGTLAIAYGSDGFGSFTASYDGALGAAVKTSAAGVTTFTSASWTLTIDETTGAYVFTQTAPYAHDPGASSDSGIVTVSVADSDDVAPVTVNLTLTITDDAPLAVNDGSGATEGGATLNGNVIANDDVGADLPGTVSAARTGPEAGAGTALVVGTPYVSTFGTLTLNADGSYSYTPNGSVPAGSVDVFTYTLIDADGDTDTAELRFTFAGDNSNASASNGAATTSDAAGDADPGSNVNAFTPQVSSGTLAIAYGSDGFGSFTASYDGALGAAVKTSAAGVTTFTSASWTLTIDETTGAYVFTQTAPYAHDPGASSDSGIVTVSVADSDDVAPVTVNLTLTITDDAPLAVNDGSGATEGGATLNGNVIANDDVGADLPGTVSAARTGPEAGAGTALVVGTPYVSTFGTLTLNADGSYSYTPNGSVPAGSVDVFTYTLIDADGDTDTAELRFTFAGDNSNASASNGAATTSDAAGDADPGSNVNAFTPQVSSGTLAIAYGSDGFGSFTASYDGALGAAVKTSAAGVTTFTSASWTLTIDETTGAYVFTQTAPYAHDPGASSDSGIVTVSVADSDDVAPVTVNLTLTITDDAPLAVNDGSGATEGGATLNGNVIANDDVGADLPGTVSAARTGPEAGAGTALVVGTPYVSTFGTLTLNADGSYSYTPNGSVPAGSVDVFTYTLIDADGDTDTAELRFTFAGDNSNASASNGAATTSDAAGDADPGSNVNAFTPQVSSGTLAIAYGSDGFGSFTASYDGALGAAVKTSAAGVTTFTSASWTLTIDETTGAYVFTQTAPYAHDPGASSDSGIVTVSVADSDDVAPVTVNLTLTITDDAPLAVNDGSGATEGGATLNGNVIANDDVGADLPGTVSAARTGPEAGAGTALVVGTPYVSTFGTLTLNADGSYSYTPNGSVPAGSVDVFTYTLIDADGDTDTAELRFTFAGDNSNASASNGAATTSDAAGDADPGSNVNAFTPQVSSGTLAIAYGSDGFGSFTASYDGALGAAVKTSAAGVTTFTSASWTLTIDETTGAYVFTQTAPYAHDPGASSDSGIVTVSVADSDDVAPVTVNLTLTITDDAPLAVNDGSGATEGGATLNGNVIANDDVGADLPGTVSAARTGPEAGAGTALVVGTPYVSTFGTLTLNADGSYSYTPNGSVPAGSVDVFTYTLIDADGDTDTAELRFTFAGDNSNASASNGAATTSDAAGDADPGSNVNAFTPQVSSGTLAIAYGSDGFGSFTASYDGALGAAVKTSAAGVTTFTSASWTLTIDETTGAYVFTQTAPYAHDPGASSDSGIVTVSVADSDDVAPVTVNLTLTITDDAPLAVNDGSGATEGGATLNGNVIANDDVGADLPGTVSAARTGPEAGAGTALVVGTPYVSTFGTLTLNADGSYSYTPNGSVPAGSVDVFTYTLIDADGDTDTAELRFTFAGDNSNASASNGAATTSDAAGDADPGSNVNAFTPQVSSGTLAIAYGSDGFGSFTASYDGALGAAVKTSAAGVTTFTSASWTLTIDETTGAYVFTQTAPYAHDPGASSDSGIVTVSVADSDDVAPVTVNLTLTITDDAPLAVNDGSGATEGGATLNGNVIANDDVGADLPGTVSAARTGPEAGAGTALVVGTPYVSTFGTLTLNADGSYSYTPNGSVPAGSVDVFTYTLIDADGDTDTAELRFTFAGDNSNASASNGAATTSDAAGDADPGSNVNAFTPQVSSGTLAIAYGSDGFGSFTASYDGALGAAVKTSAAGVTTFTSASWTLTIDETTGAYVFTQTAPYAHDPGASSDSGIVTVSVADSDDVAPVTVNLTLTITDDAPLAVNDSPSVNEDAPSVSGNVIANDDVGADVPGAITAIRTGSEAGAGTAGTLGVGLAGTYGTLTLNADGDYTYAPNNSLPGIQALGVTESVTDVFTYTVRDADGDTDTAQITVTINGSNDAPIVQNSAVWMPSDPAQQTASSPTFPNGYLMNAVVPTDIDGDNLIITATNTVSGVYYFDAGSASYVAVTTGTVLYNTSTGVNFIDDLVYRPTGAIADTQNLQLNMSVFDGTTTLGQSVFIHEVPQARLPGQSVQIGDGSSPLTSGNDQVQDFTLSAEFASGLQGNLNIAQIVVKTDFQQLPMTVPVPAAEQNPGVFGDASAGSHREQEVQVEVRIGANRFVIVEDDLAAGTFEQSWFYDPASGLMQATVLLSNVYLLDGAGNATATTLAQYLGANPPAGGDTWTVTYYDNDGGSWQARLVQFRFEFDDAGNPAITVNGDGLPDTIYGGTGNDILNGGGGQDTIFGRGGNDTITGGSGNDWIDGGAGMDTVTDAEPGDTISGVPPIVLDLDGDGPEFLPLSAGVRYDYGGDSNPEGTAWAGPDDAILAIDRNGNGAVDDGSEFVFAADRSTDLEGLAARYDTNGDGRLDADDAAFAQFGIWQDANSNGLCEVGEFVSLSQSGIASISLRSDGQTYAAASGNVRVAGSAFFTRTDASTGTLADAAFAVANVLSAQRPLVGLTNATAAAGVLLASADFQQLGPDANLAASLAGEEYRQLKPFLNEVVVGDWAQGHNPIESIDFSALSRSTDVESASSVRVDGFAIARIAANDVAHDSPRAIVTADTQGSGHDMSPTMEAQAFGFIAAPEMAAMQNLLALTSESPSIEAVLAPADGLPHANDVLAVLVDALAETVVDHVIDRFVALVDGPSSAPLSGVALDGELIGGQATWMSPMALQSIDAGIEHAQAHAG